jgi:hypothetical protein
MLARSLILVAAVLLPVVVRSATAPEPLFRIYTAHQGPHGLTYGDAPAELTVYSVFRYALGRPAADAPAKLPPALRILLHSTDAAKFAALTEKTTGGLLVVDAGEQHIIALRIHGKIQDGTIELIGEDAREQIEYLYRKLEKQNASNQTMQRTVGRLGSSLSMKFHPQPAATRHLASRR